MLMRFSQGLVVLLFSSMLDRAPASASTISQTTSQHRNLRVWSQKLEMSAARSSAYPETSENQKQGKI